MGLSKVKIPTISPRCNPYYDTLGYRYLTDEEISGKSEEEINELIVLCQKVADRSDMQMGYNDAINGCYDTWYEKNRTGNGNSYKRGVLQAKAEGLITGKLRRF